MLWDGGEGHIKHPSVLKDLLDRLPDQNWQWQKDYTELI